MGVEVVTDRERQMHEAVNRELRNRNDALTRRVAELEKALRVIAGHRISTSCGVDCLDETMTVARKAIAAS